MNFLEKDASKLMSRTLLTYAIILSFVFIMKLFGLDYFGLDTENKIIVGINDFILKFHLENIWYAFTLYLNTYIILSTSTNDNSKTMKKYVLYTMVLSIFIHCVKVYVLPSNITSIIDFLYLFILMVLYNIFVKKQNIKRYNIGNYFTVTLIMILLQIVSMVIRDVDVQLVDNDFIVSNLLALDYLILFIMLQKLYFIKGGKSLCQMVLGSFSDLLISLKDFPTKLHQSYQIAKPKTSEENLANKIYIVLFWLYNFFTLFVILLIATLNETFIECIFIVSSFWINKAVFGKAFHLKKASTCFIVSSLSYYTLNRLTWKIGISFLIPVVLGITLSYITSKFMARRENLYLYRGMKLDDFYTLITRATNNHEHIEICKMFYVEKETDVKIAYKFNYSVANVKKIKQKVNKQIKELQ